MSNNITDEQRREVARRLRELAAQNDGALGRARMLALLAEGQRVLGTSRLSNCAAVLRRYADLIDPGEDA